MLKIKKVKTRNIKIVRPASIRAVLQFFARKSQKSNFC